MFGEQASMFTPTIRCVDGGCVYVRWRNVIGIVQSRRSGMERRWTCDGEGNRNGLTCAGWVQLRDSAGVGSHSTRTGYDVCMLTTSAKSRDDAATPLERSVWTAEESADDIRDLGETA